MDQTDALRAELAEAKAALGELRLQLDMLSTSDPLTGLLNRNGIFDAVDAATARQAVTSEPFALLLVVVPGLGLVRAAHGDSVYAEFLRDAAALTAATLRDMDVIGRIAEGTFLCVLPWMSREGADTVARRLDRVLFTLDPSLAPEFATVAADPFAPADADILLAALSQQRPLPIAD